MPRRRPAVGRDVYRGAVTGTQYVVDGDGRRVYGVWGYEAEDEEAAPVHRPGHAMRYAPVGAGVALMLPALFLGFLWLIQVTSGVAEPGRDGPDFIGTAVMMLWTLLSSSPFLPAGAVVGGVIGTIAWAFMPARKSGAAGGGRVG